MRIGNAALLLAVSALLLPMSAQALGSQVSISGGFYSIGTTTASYHFFGSHSSLDIASGTLSATAGGFDTCSTLTGPLGCTTSIFGSTARGLCVTATATTASLAHTATTQDTECS